MIVYHYCSLYSFNSILKNRSLRLTNILKSNDSMEIRWICRYYETEFEEAYEKTSDLFKTCISSERFMGYVKLFTDEFFDENHADFRYYVTCFSYQNDLLSQWRGYADDGRGAAIGFDLDVLKEIAIVSPEISKPSIVSLHKISYSEAEQREVVHQVVNELVTEIEEVLQRGKKNREGSEKVQDYKLELIETVMGCFEKKFLKLFQESVYMKNPFFREESEIRLCEFSPKQFLMGREVKLSLGARLHNYSYYVRENQLISYVDFDFSDCFDQLIKEVVIGPKCQMSERDMEYYLTTLGLPRCQVNKSQGTYR
ncbi:MAG: DUF2971 domain-containing protein [Ruminococcus sp.]|nr:DUF2971 domain-containing protein [Ruminococcus sp.]